MALGAVECTKEGRGREGAAMLPHRWGQCRASDVAVRQPLHFIVIVIYFVISLTAPYALADHAPNPPASPPTFYGALASALALSQLHWSPLVAGTKLWPSAFASRNFL